MSDFDFAKYFSNFVKNNVETKDEMIRKYVDGKITKKQLDEFMKTKED